MATDADRASRLAHCPVCLPGTSRDLFGLFSASTDDELFALIADHVMKVHGGGPGDAFSAAEDALPWVGMRYRAELRDQGPAAAEPSG